jgi:glycosyltransferase involved in cell wall biosynthesis
VAARIPALQLELAGAPIPGDAPAFEAGLRQRAAQPDLAGRVTFLGPLPDPRPALARAHCLLHCADAEPWGLALVEALAAGRPVVAADAAGPREIVTGSAGRRFPPGDAAAAAAALHAVLADPAAPAAARSRAETFPVEASAARFEAALEAVAR